MSRDAAEAGSVHVGSGRGERGEVALPREAQGDGGAESGHLGAALVEQAADLVEPVKPRLRGWLHAGMVPASLTAGIALIWLARTPQAVWACAVYAVTAWLLFATSAIYHRVPGGR